LLTEAVLCTTNGKDGDRCDREMENPETEANETMAFGGGLFIHHKQFPSSSKYVSCTGKILLSIYARSII